MSNEIEKKQSYESEQVGTNTYLDTDFLWFQNKMPWASDDIKDTIATLYEAWKKIWYTEAENTKFLKKMTVWLLKENITIQQLSYLKYAHQQDWQNWLQGENVPWVILDYIRDADLSKRQADNKEIDEENNKNTWKDTEITNTLEKSQEKVKILQAINTQLITSLQKDPLKLTDEQQATVKVNLSQDAKDKMKQAGIKDPEATYGEYLYALHHPTEMPQSFRNIIGNNDPQELLQQFNADYGITMMTEKKVDQDTYDKTEKDRTLDANITTVNTRKSWKLSFRGAFSAFEKQYFDHSQKIHTILDTAAKEYMGRDWLVDKKDSGENRYVAKKEFEDIWLALNWKWVISLQDLDRKKIQYLLTGVVPEDKMKEYSRIVMGLIKNIKKNPDLLKNPDKDTKENLTRFNWLIRQRFRLETQNVIKKQVAQEYFGEIADAMEAGGENIIMDTDMDAVTYDDQNNMIIKYHTEQGIAWQMVVDAQWYVTITDFTSKYATNSTEKNDNIIQKAQRKLAWRLVPIDEMMKRAAGDNNKSVYAEARKNHMWQNSYESNFYQETLVQDIKEKKVLAFTLEQERSKNLINASLDNGLYTTRVFNSLITFASPFQEWVTDPCIEYFSGKSSFLDKQQNKDHQSIFAMRDWCAQATSWEMKSLEQSISKLDETYQKIDKKDNPFYNEFGKENLWKFFDYFRTTDQSNGWFDAVAFSRFVDQLAIDKPQSIEAWITQKEERLRFIPMQSPYHRELESKYCDSSSEAYLWQNIDSAYPSKK